METYGYSRQAREREQWAGDVGRSEGVKQCLEVVKYWGEASKNCYGVAKLLGRGPKYFLGMAKEF